jgi:hypothetical protein
MKEEKVEKEEIEKVKDFVDQPHRRYNILNNTRILCSPHRYFKF